MYDSMQDLHNTLTEERDLLKKLIKSLQECNRRLADAEQTYRRRYTEACIRIKLDGIEGKKGKTEPVAWTMTGELARGIQGVASARHERDVLKGEKEAILQKIYQTKIEIDLLTKEMEAIRRGE